MICFFNNLKNHIAICALVLLVLAFLACTSKKTVIDNSIIPEKTAFFTLNAVRDSAQKITRFFVTNVNVVNTKINYTIDKSKAKNSNFLKIQITYTNNMIIDAIMDHPLFKRFEIYSETGEIESKSISLQQGQVTLRVPYFESYKKIKVTEIINFVEEKQIILKNEN
jgi:hypothetical protein